ncbi:Crinkler (CRN) family protein [Phytophthora palmivora]|uniref:Crinkler (CRN) family protein n=1 Tax=Phytophthora palmivora TaxID=4796 RepID=A0A2P4YEJ0_9STRA|nr:Crinkler (CRN) family protein [Phytophthora palmivora]
MVKISLVCCVVGDGKVFAVAIDSNKVVAFLKDAIKKKKPDTINVFAVAIDSNKVVAFLKKKIKKKKPDSIKCEDNCLKLYMAKKEDKMWLNAADAAAVTLGGSSGVLDERGNRHNFELMDSLLFLKNTKYFGANFQPGEGEIHLIE